MPKRLVGGAGEGVDIRRFLLQTDQRSASAAEDPGAERHGLSRATYGRETHEAQAVEHHRWTRSRRCHRRRWCGIHRKQHDPGHRDGLRDVEHHRGDGDVADLHAVTRREPITAATLVFTGDITTRPSRPASTPTPWTPAPPAPSPPATRRSSARWARPSRPPAPPRSTWRSARRAPLAVGDGPPPRRAVPAHRGAG